MMYAVTLLVAFIVLVIAICFVLYLQFRYDMRLLDKPQPKPRKGVPGYNEQKFPPAQMRDL